MVVTTAQHHHHITPLCTHWISFVTGRDELMGLRYLFDFVVLFTLQFHPVPFPSCPITILSHYHPVPFSSRPVLILSHFPPIPVPLLDFSHFYRAVSGIYRFVRVEGAEEKTPHTAVYTCKRKLRTYSINLTTNRSVPVRIMQCRCQIISSIISTVHQG